MSQLGWNSTLGFRQQVKDRPLEERGCVIVRVSIVAGPSSQGKLVHDVQDFEFVFTCL
jgi:hypothetical protein